jgi:hypothetical protein
LTPVDEIVLAKVARPRVLDIAKSDAERVRENLLALVRRSPGPAPGPRKSHLQEVLDEISRDKSELQVHLTELQLRLTKLQSEREVLLKAEASIGALLDRARTDTDPPSEIQFDDAPRKAAKCTTTKRAK